MAVNTLICPNCKKNIELSEALLHEFQEEFELKHKKDMAEAVRLAQEKSEKDFAQKNEQVLAKYKKEIEDQQSEEINKLKSLNEKASEELKKKELLAIEERRKLDEEKRDLELIIARKTEEERKKWEERISKEKEEEYRFKEKEKEMQIDNLKRMLEEANRKASGVSQQVQGEVLELDLEENLRTTFPTDEVTGVAKGARGADILQIVKINNQVAGKILWETKRAKWTPSWIAKLRDDSRKEGASISVLITEELPKEIKTFGPVEGVLVAGYPYVIPLAAILRRQLIAISQAKITASNKDEKLESLYQYLQSDMFRHHIEAFVEAIVGNQEDLETEKRSMTRIWKKREMQIQRSINNVSNMYGELQGIMGKSLPDIKHLSLDSGEDEE